MLVKVRVRVELTFLVFSFSIFMEYLSLEIDLLIVTFVFDETKRQLFDSMFNNFAVILISFHFELASMR